MNKLILEENEILDFDSNSEEVETAANTAAVTSTFTELIKEMWQLIDTLNSAAINLSATGDGDITGVIGEIIKDEYIHIGQLEKSLNLLVPESEAIEDGEILATEPEEPTDEVIDDISLSDIEEE